jgi:hypothetical protein
MPEVLEPPATNQADSDSLKASFNTALKTETDLRPVPAEVPAEVERNVQPDPTLAPDNPPEKKEDKKVEQSESIVPDQFTTKEQKKPEVENEEIPVNAGTKQLRDVLARRDAKLKEQQATLAELRAKLETTPVNPSKEHEEMVRAANARAAELESKLERAAYADSPKFQRFNAEHTAEITTAKSYLEGTEISPTILDVAASQSGQARLKTLRDAGMDAETIAAVGPHLARADSIRRERDASLENWKQTHAQEIEQQKAQQTRQEQEQQAKEQVILNEVAAEKMKGNPAFTEVEGHPKWNAMVAQNKKDAEDFAFGRKPLKELFELGYDGVSARTLKVMNGELEKKLNALTEEVSRLRAVQPGTGTSVAATAGDVTKPTDETSEHKAAFNKAMEKLPGRG